MNREKYDDAQLRRELSREIESMTDERAHLLVEAIHRIMAGESAESIIADMKSRKVATP